MYLEKILLLRVNSCKDDIGISCNESVNHQMNKLKLKTL